VVFLIIHIADFPNRPRLAIHVIRAIVTKSTCHQTGTGICSVGVTKAAICIAIRVRCTEFAKLFMRATRSQKLVDGANSHNIIRYIANGFYARAIRPITRDAREVP